MSSGHHCYPGTDILINKYGLKDKELLDELEVQKVSVKLLSLSYDLNKIEPTCDAEHLKRLHKYLFFDLYSWAGQFREENFYKEERVLSGGSVQYCDYKLIKTELDNLFKKYDSSVWQNEANLVANTLNFLTDLWIIHPFREGNTRTCVTFLWHFLYAYGIEFNVDLLKKHPLYVRDSLVMASYGESSYLSTILTDALSEKGLVSVGEIVNDANEKYKIAKEEYKTFKEKYLLAGSDTELDTSSHLNKE